MLGAIAVGVCLCAVTAGPATAARLPTHPEAKALSRAFKHAKGTPRRAVVTAMEVSTVDPHWARVLYGVAPKKHGAAAARPKILVFDANLSGSKNKPKAKRAKHKPPKKVRKNEEEPLYVYLTYSLTGGEDASKSHTEPDAEGPGCDVTQSTTVHSTISLTATLRADVLHPTTWSFNEQTLKIDVVVPAITPLDPTSGSTDLTVTHRTVSCSSEQAQTCTTHYPINPPGLAFSVFAEPQQTEFQWFLAFDPIAEATCDDGQRQQPFADRQDLQGHDSVVVPIAIGVGGNVAPSNSYPFSFSSNAPTNDNDPHSTTTGLCKNEPAGECSDDFNWSGTLKFGLQP
ncbi:MAG: hypothetical protein QOG63_696 [Thermoleophilaceae bacterium]|nr:hypothetical protein [Thermoleophilaceae bacterium]